MGEGDKPGGPGRGPFIVSPVPAFVRPAASAPSAFYPPSNGMALPESIQGGASEKKGSNPPKNNEVAALEARIKGLESELSDEKATHSQDVANLKLKIARLVKKLSDANPQSGRGSEPPQSARMTQRAPLEEDSMGDLGDLEGLLRLDASEIISRREGAIGTEFDPSNTTPGYEASLPDASMLDQNGMTMRTNETPETPVPLPDLNGMAQRAIAGIHPEPLPQLPNLGRKMFGTVVVTEASASEDIEDSGRPTLVDAVATEEGIRLSIRMGAEIAEAKAVESAADTDPETKKKKGGPEGEPDGSSEGFGIF